MTDGAFGHNCEMGRRNDQKHPSFFNVFIGFIRKFKPKSLRRTTYDGLFWCSPTHSVKKLLFIRVDLQHVVLHEEGYLFTYCAQDELCMRNGKSWLARNHDNKFEWSDMSTCGMLFLRSKLYNNYKVSVFV
jgi:hypothetical protein